MKEKPDSNWWGKEILTALLAVFAFALIIRLIFLSQISGSPSFHTPIIDADTYHQHARLLAEEGEMSARFFWQGFFYPLFLAGLYKLAGTTICGAKMVQLLLGSALAGGGGVILAGLLVVLIPVSSLSLEYTGDFSPLPRSGALNLYIGNNPDTEETMMIRPGMEWRELTRMPMLEGSETEQQDRMFFSRLFREYVTSHPLDYLAGLGWKGMQFLSSRELPRNIDPYTFREFSGLYSILTWKTGGFGFPFGILLPLAITGLYF